MIEYFSFFFFFAGPINDRGERALASVIWLLINSMVVALVN